MEQSGSRRAFIGFGANLGDTLATYATAKAILIERLGPIRGESLVYESAALTLDGAESQSNYINTALEFFTPLSPQEILAILLETELVFGRDRRLAERWAPRPIDLDLLFVGDLVLSDTGLSLPHPEIHKRDFVLAPLCDIAPDFIHPELGVSLVELERTLEGRGFERLINVSGYKAPSAARRA
jgi:2-amino-4-hydroxy-6-hydroxymethyldihydropteridine diphosphokinase